MDKIPARAYGHVIKAEMTTTYTELVLVHIITRHDKVNMHLMALYISVLPSGQA